METPSFTSFIIPAQTADTQKAVDELSTDDFSEKALRETLEHCTVGVSPPGTKCGVRMWNRTNLQLRVRGTQGTNHVDSIDAGGQFGWFVPAPLDGKSFFIEDASGTVRHTVQLTEAAKQQIFVQWKPAPCPAGVTEVEGLLGEAAISMRKAERNLFVQTPPRLSGALGWLKPATAETPATVKTALEQKLGVAKAAEVLRQFRTYVGNLEALAKGLEKPQSVGFNNNNGCSQTYNSYHTPVLTPHAGLLNQGTTCYMNSLVQALFFTPELRYALFQKWQYDTERDPEKERCIPYQLQMLFSEMQLHKTKAASTDALTKSFGWEAGDQFEQQDASEFFTVLTDALETCFKGTPGDGIVKALYQGQQTDLIRCRSCGYQNLKTAAFTTLDLSIRGFGEPAICSVEEGLAKFFRMEKLSDYTCEKCKAQDAEKGLRLSKAPYVLTVTMKRFTYDWELDRRVKVNDSVAFPETLDLAPFLEREDAASPDTSPAAARASDEVQDLSRSTSRRDFGKDDGALLARGVSAVIDDRMPYELYAICIHSGGTSGGHYYAYVKDFSTGLWFNFNDSSVTRCYDIKQAYGGVTFSYANGYRYQNSTSAYMLMYRRRDQPGSDQLNINDIPNSAVPAYLLADKQAESEAQAEEEARKKAEAEQKRQEQERRRRQIPLAVWYGDRAEYMRPEKSSTWAELHAAILKMFAVQSAPENSRLVLCKTGRYPTGTVGTVIEVEPDERLDQVPDLENQMLLLEVKTSGVDWPAGRYSIDDTSDDRTIIAFTDVDGDDFRHSLHLARSTTVESATRAIADYLSSDTKTVAPASILMHDLDGSSYLGYRASRLYGTRQSHSPEVMVGAMRKITQRSGGCTGGDVHAEVGESVEGCESVSRRRIPCQIYVWNLSDKEVTVWCWTRDDYNYTYFKKRATVQPGGRFLDSTVLESELAESQSVGCQKCESGVLWKVEIGSNRQRLLSYEWTNPRSPLCHVVIEGDGIQRTALRIPRVMFSVKTNPWFVEGAANLADGHHMVPVYEYTGMNDAATFLLDMELNETMLVADFKAMLVETLREAEGANAAFTDPANVRVRKLPQGTVLADHEKLMPYHFATVAFAVNTIEGPETKNDTNKVLSIFKFSPSKMALEPFFEIVADNSMKYDDLRAFLADNDPCIVSADDVQLGIPGKLVVGHQISELTQTVWDTKLMDWDWDKSIRNAYREQHVLSKTNYYVESKPWFYRNAAEEQMKISSEDEQRLKKRAIIEKRKKAQASKKNHTHADETGVVMNVATRASDEAAPPTEEGIPNMTVVQVNEVDAADAQHLPLARTISAGVRSELLADATLSDTQRAALQEHHRIRMANSTGSEEISLWLQQTSSRQDFAKALAQRDALQAITSEGLEGHGLPPVTLEQLQTLDIRAEKEKVAAEVSRLRAELGLDGNDE